MSQQPFSNAPARGAVDLSGLATEQTPAAAPQGSANPFVVAATADTISGLLNGSMTVPTVLVVWSASRGGKELVDGFDQVAREQGGRILVATVDIDTNPELARALQVQQIPVAFAVLQGQPMPLLMGAQPKEVLVEAVEQLLQVAVQNGITGRAPGEVAATDDAPLPPLHQEAYDAIERGDLAAAAEAYRKAIAENPKDRDAALGLAQISLIERTADVDQAAARQAAADHPEDVDAQLLVADIDVLGGHVEDAFARLLDVVRLGGDGREKARLHLIDLFDVIGAEDERVRKARTALMSALF